MEQLKSTIELSKSALGNENIATLVKREKNIAIYKRGNSIYEVFKVNIQKASEQVINGRKVVYEEKEVYPTTAQFGYDAYCCGSIEQAEKRFSELLSKQDE